MALLFLDEIMNFANCVWMKIGLSDTHTLLNSSMCMCLFHIIDPYSESGLKYKQWMLLQFIYKH